MSLNQYALYQLKPLDSLRPLRNKSYQYVLEHHIAVVSDNYWQVYISPMARDTTPEAICRQLELTLPQKLAGTALKVSDVIVITRDGITAAYYVDVAGLIALPGFFRINSSAALITIDTSGVLLEGRIGSWMATDATIIDGKQYFLMASESAGRNAAYAVVDDQGHRVAHDTKNGFDDTTVQQIRSIMSRQPHSIDTSRTQNGAVKLELYQKYYENGEYLRTLESGTEQNYSMIDGVSNNKGVRTSTRNTKEGPERKETKPKERTSVLERLREKQKEVAVRYSRKVPEQEKGDMELSRK